MKTWNFFDCRKMQTIKFYFFSHLFIFLECSNSTTATANYLFCFVRQFWLPLVSGAVLHCKIFLIEKFDHQCNRLWKGIAQPNPFHSTNILICWLVPKHVSASNTAAATGLVTLKEQNIKKKCYKFLLIYILPKSLENLYKQK